MKTPSQIQGMDGIAEIIAQTFGTELGMQCSRFLISRWRKGEYLPDGVEPFPPPDNGNRFNVPKCLEWVRKYIEGKKAKPSATLQQMEDRAEATARRERAKADREERANLREAGILIERAVAENDAIGIIQRLHNSCTYHDEQEIPNFCRETLKNLGAHADLIAALSAKLIEKMQSITARRVEAFKNATDEFLNA